MGQWHTKKTRYGTYYYVSISLFVISLVLAGKFIITEHNIMVQKNNIHELAFRISEGRIIKHQTKSQLPSNNINTNQNEEVVYCSPKDNLQDKSAKQQVGY